MPSSIGWPGPGRLDFGYEDMVTPITGLMTVDTLIAGDMDLFQERAGAPDPAGFTARLFLAGPTSAA